jgi:hypothetical protein
MLGILVVSHDDFDSCCALARFRTATGRAKARQRQAYPNQSGGLLSRLVAIASLRSLLIGFLPPGSIQLQGNFIQGVGDAGPKVSGSSGG